MNFCPVISFSGTEMKKYNQDVLLQQLKRAYAERAVENGFDDNNLYNQELLKLVNIVFLINQTEHHIQTGFILI